MAKFLETVVDDFRKARAFRHRVPDWNEDQIWKRDSSGRLVNLFPTVQDVWNYCLRNRNKLNAVDVETTGEQAMDCLLICIGFATEEGDVLCVPFLRQGGIGYWSAPDLQRVLELLRWFLADIRTPKVMHNGAFDSVVLKTHGFDVFYAWAEDTMQMHHVWDSELPHGLDYCASRELEVPYWKDAVKGDKRWLALPDEVLRSYNVRDCLATVRIAPRLAKKLQSHSGLWECYREELEVCKEMARATLAGIWMDPAKRGALSSEYHQQADESITAMRSIVRDPGFNPASPVQLQKALFQTCGFPIVLRTAKGAPSTNKDAMVLLALHSRTLEQATFLHRLARWRKVTKALSTWIDGAKILSDGCLHPSWKMLTVSGRLASSPNAQNWPTKIKAIYGVDPDHELVGVDLSQAELRMMAYTANDADLLLMYELGLNVHTINTTLLFGVRNPGIAEHTSDATEAYLEDMVPKLRNERYADLPVLKKSAWKSSRTLGKNFVFGDNYGAVAETLHRVIRAKRDPDSDAALFPDVTLGEIEAAKIRWEGMHPAIPRWWSNVANQVQRDGFYQCPISGRVRWFRAGFNRNQILNYPIQTGVGSHMNRAMLKIAPRLRSELHPSTQIIAQVHDMLGVRCVKGEGKRAGEIMVEELAVTRALPGFPRASLPADGAVVGRYLNEV